MTRFRGSKLRTICRWSGLALSLLILIGFVYSTQSVVSWVSADTSYGADLMLGALGISWRPNTFDRASERYPPRPGWLIGGGYAGSPPLQWWFECGASRTWEWLFIPLWVPWALVTLPIATLWYADRHSVRATLARYVDYIRPRERKRLRVTQVLAFLVLHISLLMFLGSADTAALNFFAIDPLSTFQWLVGSTLTLLFYGTPLFAVLWAYLYVRSMNRLQAGRSGWCCSKCGYDLTGNVSGVCPECGSAVTR